MIDGHLVTPLGLAALFVGVVGAIVMAGSIGKERSEISASLATIEAIGGPMPDDMRKVYDKPFSERVAQPTQAWFANLARTLSGVNWAKNMTRRLEMAGNPRAGTPSASWRGRLSRESASPASSGGCCSCPDAHSLHSSGVRSLASSASSCLTC